MASQSIGDAAERVNLLMSEIQHRLFAGMTRKPKMSNLPDVTMRQLKLLRLLGQHDSVAMKELARMAGISMPTATGLVDRMVENGLVVRVDDPGDRRVVRVQLTRKAKGLRDRFRRLRGEKIDRVLSQLNNSDRRRLVEAFETIDKILQQVEGG